MNTINIYWDKASEYGVSFSRERLFCCNRYYAILIWLKKSIAKEEFSRYGKFHTQLLFTVQHIDVENHRCEYLPKEL